MHNHNSSQHITIQCTSIEEYNTRVYAIYLPLTPFFPFSLSLSLGK